MHDLLNKAVKPGESLLDVERMVADVVARKGALYPDDKRAILTHRVSGSRSNTNIVVEHSPPDEK